MSRIKPWLDRRADTGRVAKSHFRVKLVGYLHSCFFAACLLHGSHLALNAVCPLHHILPLLSEHTCCMSKKIHTECLLLVPLLTLARI